MQVQDLFEAHYAEAHGMELAYVRDQRMGEDSYRLPSIASGWRMFRAGFEAKEGELLRAFEANSMRNARTISLEDFDKMLRKPRTVTPGIDSEGESGGKRGEIALFWCKNPGQQSR